MIDATTIFLRARASWAGRTPYSPLRDRDPQTWPGTVEALARLCIPQEEIARELGISPKTLRRGFRPELDRAVEHVRNMPRIKWPSPMVCCGGHGVIHFGGKEARE